MARKKHSVVQYHEFDFFQFHPKTQSQAEAAYEFRQGQNLLLSGYAGTGKTYLAISLAIELVKKGEAKSICIFRSAVPTRDIGFLPGTEDEKMAAYEKSVKQLFGKITKNDTAYSTLKSRGVVGFGSTSFERGMTYDDCVMIVDEVQNMTFEEINTLITRLGDTSRIILSGDFRQSDINGYSGFHKAVKIIDRMPSTFTHIDFEINDIVRSGLVKDWIIACGELDQKSLEPVYAD